MMQVSEDMIEAMARLAGFSIDPGFRSGVAANLALLLDRAALIATPPLDAGVEPAPVFRA